MAYFVACVAFRGQFVRFPEGKPRFAKVRGNKNGTQMGPRWSKRAQDGPKMAHDGPKMPKFAPRWPKIAAKMTQDGSKVAQDGSKMVPSWCQDGPR